MKYHFLLLFSLSLLLLSCQSDPVVGNPAAPNFNAAESDQVAIDLADDVMEAMGGRKAWDTTRYIGWNFFGRRTHMWDKQEERVRIDIPSDTLSMIVNLKMTS